jgi:hypothetical protein
LQAIEKWHEREAKDKVKAREMATKRQGTHKRMACVMEITAR